MKFKSRMGLGYLRHLPIPFLRSSSSSAAIKIKKNEHLICDDISNGREAIKIPALSYKRNDNPPLDFYYVTDHITYEDPLDMDTTLLNVNCCNCLGDCSGTDCACISRYNSVRVYNAEGRLSDEYDVNAPEVIMECNARCWCNPKKCQNMVIQNGPKSKLALIRTKSRGWGIRTLEPLKRGTFIGVYSGELMGANQSFGRNDDTYLFNLESVTDRNRREQSCNSNAQSSMVEPDHEHEGEECSCAGGNIVVDESDLETATEDNKQQREQETEEDQLDQGQQEEEEEEEEEEEPSQTETNDRPKVERQLRSGPFVCDAKFFGNFTRFINHSCEPNVVGIRTFTVHQDRRFPYISFFTNKDIPANTELTLNYGDNYWLVKCRRDGIYCLCKQPSCRFTRKSYPETLRQHQKNSARSK